MADSNVPLESAKSIVDEAQKARADLMDLHHNLQGGIDEIVLTAARANRDLTEEERTRRKELRAQQAEVQHSMDELAFATLARLNKSADVAELKTRLDLVNADLTDDLQGLKRIARYAAIAAKVADGLAQLTTKVAGVLA